MTESLSYMDAPLLVGMVQLTDFDEIGEVLRSRTFVQGAYPSSATMPGTVSMLDGPEHLQRRRLLGKLFTEEAIAAYRGLHLIPVVQRCLAEVAAERSGDGVVRADLVPLIQRCMYRIAAAVNGIDGVDTQESVERFIELIFAIGAACTVDWSLEDHDLVNQRRLEAREALRREFFDPSVERRLKLIEAGDELPLDLITLMYGNWDESWHEDQPLHELAVLLVGSTQTSATAFVQFILRLERWFEEHPDDRRLIADDPEFLRHAVYESLRLTVAAPARIRIAAEDVTLASGREIKQGDHVALHFIPAHMQREQFGEHPEEFDPRRETDVAPWGYAFGGGAHACLGRPLVTGIKSKGEAADGSMVSISRLLYAAGLELDATPRPDESTYYENYSTVPIRFTNL